MDKYTAQLIAHFKEIVALDEHDIKAIIPKLEIKELDKKDYLLQPGQVSRHMRFIAQGSLHSYYTDDAGREHTMQLGIENWWINDLYSYLSESASRMYIQAVENTTLVQIHKNNLELLYKEVPKISDFWRLKMQGAYLILQERTFENMRFDAYTRYKTFINNYPDIEQRFPQYMIASYLGITIEYLSALRKKHIADRS
ncbi:cyclic nucleotide-binding protein [Elizabethkingia miricola]|uniref:CRP-like cAMP-binding protein n=1 Tax=Elizabethkingia miricola TaxID=172045 RepID=A0ABY3NB05_ELIMR|nr:Crp/Fnr family transcriptional regulator [Elizabethkingia miricola]OBS13441.1 cyclic nucleotide-binding protein [Elizabethkingia miricola]TYO84682.1 CRP-like cAMP-binding protein [Elizabethkingia miricola]